MSDRKTSAWPWATGAVAPVGTETTATDLEVDGTIPPELTGRFVKIGPNPLREWRRTRNLPFLADGMVHGVRLRDGEAEWYRSRWIRSGRVSRALGEKRAPGPRHNLIDTVNTNVIGHAGMTLALVEAGCTPVRLGFDLETLCYTDLRGSLPRGFSAHPKVDPVTGELHAVAYRPASRKVDHVVVGADGVVARSHTLKLAGMPLLHDIALTANHVLLFDLPLQFRIRFAVQGVFYGWDHDHVPRIGVMSRSDNKIRWFEIDPCFIVHTFNAYEDGDVIVLDAMRYDHRPGENFGESPRAHSHPWRWRIDLRRGTARGEQLGDRYEEFPRINENLLSMRNRYSYSVRWPDALDQNDACGIVKRDALTGATEVREYPPGRSPSEPVFVARPGAAEEDDGWLVTFVTDLARDRSDLVLLDARSVRSEPVAVVRLPVRVPMGFHGNWIPDHC